MFKFDMIVQDSFFPFDRAADSARLFFGQRNHNRDVTGNRSQKELEVSQSELHHVLTLRDFDKLSWTIMDRLIANMIVNDSEW